MRKIEVIGKVTSQSVLKCTGKDWDQWIGILEKCGAKAWPRKEIVALLKQKYKLGPWWQQAVTYGFEVHSGLRKPGQNLKGLYSTVATKKYQASRKKVWDLFTSHQNVKIWLNPFSEIELRVGSQFEIYGGIFGEFRVVKKPERVRFTWQESDWKKPSTVSLYFVEKGKTGSAKVACLVAIQHEGLTSESLKNKMLKHWKEALNQMAKVLSP